MGGGVAAMMFPSVAPTVALLQHNEESLTVGAHLLAGLDEHRECSPSRLQP